MRRTQPAPARRNVHSPFLVQNGTCQPQAETCGVGGHCCSATAALYCQKGTLAAPLGTCEAVRWSRQRPADPSGVAGPGALRHQAGSWLCVAALLWAQPRAVSTGWSRVDRTLLCMLGLQGRAAKDAFSQRTRYLTHLAFMPCLGCSVWLPTRLDAATWMPAVATRSATCGIPQTSWASAAR